MRKNNVFSQKGAVSIIFAIMIMSMIVVITASMSVLMIQQIRMSGQTGHSVVAFYAADSGAERCLFEVRKNGAVNCPCTDISPCFLDFDGQAKYTITYDGSNTITSKGEYRGVSRKVELSW